MHCPRAKSAGCLHSKVSINCDMFRVIFRFSLVVASGGGGIALASEILLKFVERGDEKKVCGGAFYTFFKRECGRGG